MGGCMAVLLMVLAGGTCLIAVVFSRECEKYIDDLMPKGDEEDE